MEIAVYGPDYQQYIIDYQESDKLEAEAYSLISTLSDFKQKGLLPGEVAHFYEDLPLPRVFIGKMPWVEKKGLINRTWKNAGYSAAGSAIFIHDSLPDYAKSAFLLKELVKYYYKVNDNDALIISTKISQKLVKITKENKFPSIQLEMIQNYLETEIRRNKLI